MDSSAYVATLTDGPDDVYDDGRHLSVVAMYRGCSVNATNLVFRNYGTYISLYKNIFCDVTLTALVSCHIRIPRNQSQQSRI